MEENISILTGDCIASLKKIQTKSINCCITSPPYFGLRDYDVQGQIGLEETPEIYISKLVEVFREVRRTLRDDGTLWVNIGDSYAGSGGGNYSKSHIQTDHGKHITNIRNRPEWLNAANVKSKDLLGIPWMLAFALRADGWYLRQDIIWNKPNAMPESVRDRCTKAHEYIFLLSKSSKYYFDHTSIKEIAVSTRPSGNKSNKFTTANQRGDEKHRTKAGLFALSGRQWKTRNRRSVWNIATKAFRGAHFAVFPPELIEPCILAGCPEGGSIIDPFGGSGTSAGVALKHKRKAILCELNPQYVEMMPSRIQSIAGDLA